MSNIPEGLKYQKSHEWVKFEGNQVTIGITDHAQNELTDIVYVELPEVGKELNAGDPLVVIESVKIAADVYSPVNGKIIAVNEGLEESPELLNDDPYAQGWIVKIETDDNGENLLDSASYRSLVE